MAALFVHQNGTEDKTWFCGGSLISKDFILTSAHCIHSNDTSRYSVKLGSVNLKRFNHRHIYKVKNIIKHKNFDGTLGHNDIALLRLEKPVKITKKIKPACLSTLLYDDLIATGWGSTKNGEPLSNVLLKANLKVFPKDQCSAIPWNITLLNSTFCAGGQYTASTCDGDSGGPLQVYDESKKVYLINGITSFGYQTIANYTCIEAIPSVYQKIPDFIPWIEKHVWPKAPNY